MTDQHFIVIFAQGTREELQQIATLGKVMTTSVEVPEDLYDFLYNSLLEKATSEKRGLTGGRV